MVERNAMQEALLQILEASRLEELAKEENKGAAADDNSEQEKMMKAVMNQLEDLFGAVNKKKGPRPTVKDVGKALSLEVATRMLENKDIKTVMTKEARLKAVGTEADFPQDAMSIYMTRYAEQIFEPKRVLDSGDWLKSYKEPDQRFEYYKKGNGNIQWLNQQKNKIYLFIAENDSFTADQIAKFKLYCEAFYHGVAGVEILKAGENIPGQNRKIPANFLDNEVEHRKGYHNKTQYRTCGKTGILTQLPKYRPRDAYSTLLITMKDLFPQPSWSFCFGWASFTEGVGAFSFCRYDPAWDGIDDPDREKNLLMAGCHIMCHEIGHQFGLRHCIYYECLMNGVMSADEQRRGGIKLLCPVCTKKLKQNIKFDTKERFQKLAAACDALGFADEAAIYRKLIKDCAASGIKAGRAPAQPKAVAQPRAPAQQRVATTKVNNAVKRAPSQAAHSRPNRLANAGAAAIKNTPKRTPAKSIGIVNQQRRPPAKKVPISFGAAKVAMDNAAFDYNVLNVESEQKKAADNDEYDDEY